MQKGVVTVNEVPTYVATWGAWIEDDLKNCKDLIICISGNPGVTGYYNEFLETLYGNLNIPVWILSHAGHELSPTLEIPHLKKNLHLYTLEGQIRHKIEFLKKYVPSHVNIYFVGHSIGCQMILRVLKDYPDINSQVKKAYLLFPTIQKMKESPNGKLFTGFVQYIVPIVVLFSWIFTWLPSPVKKTLLLIYFTVQRCDYTMIRPTTKLINPRSLQNVFFLAMDEMESVKELDHETINSSAEKLFFCFSTSDGWAPLNYYESLKKSHPEVNALTCDYRHAFVLNASKEVAFCLCKWFKTQKPNLSVKAHVLTQ